MVSKTKNKNSPRTCLISFKGQENNSKGLVMLAKENGEITSAGGGRYIVPHYMCIKIKAKGISLGEEIIIVAS